MATIKDVAKLAGVSIATVSNVLNGGRYVSPELRSAVLQAVRTLGYVPNGVAQSLRSRKTQTLGLIVPDITNPFFSGLVQALERSARDRGYQMLLCNSEENAELEFDLALALASRQVDGLIVIPTQDSPSICASSRQMGCRWYSSTASAGKTTWTGWGWITSKLPGSAPSF